jgi:hypothetical protein
MSVPNIMERLHFIADQEWIAIICEQASWQRARVISHLVSARLPYLFLAVATAWFGIILGHAGH